MTFKARKMWLLSGAPGDRPKHDDEHNHCNKEDQQEFVTPDRSE
jgi:hypothetical protein